MITLYTVPLWKVSKDTTILAIEAMVITLVRSIAYVGTAGNVVKIGNVKYTRLNEAIKNVKQGKTITVLRNVDDATGISVIY